MQCKTKSKTEVQQTVSVACLLLLADKVQVLPDGPLAQVLELILRIALGGVGLGAAGGDGLAAAVGGCPMDARHGHRDHQL